MPEALKPLDMNGQKITELGDPAAAQDAVTLTRLTTNYTHQGIESKGDMLVGGGPMTLVTHYAGVTGRFLRSNPLQPSGMEWDALDAADIPALDYVPTGLVDAKGDLIVSTADNTVARLAVGSNGQVLAVDSTTGTGLKWETPAISNTGNALVRRDGLGRAQYTNPSAAQDAATKDYVDTQDGTLIPKSIGTTKGDMIAFTAAGTPVRVAASTNMNVLTVDSLPSIGVSWRSLATHAGFWGTSFPSPSSQQMYFRADIGLWCWWDGARWLECVEQDGVWVVDHESSPKPYTATGTGDKCKVGGAVAYQLQRFDCEYFIPSGHGPGQYWTIELERHFSGGWSSLGSWATNQSTNNAYTTLSKVSSDFASSGVGAANDHWIKIKLTKNGASVGNLSLVPRLTWRNIRT